MSNDKAGSILRTVVRGVWLFMCILMCLVFTYTAFQQTVQIESGLDFVLFAVLSGSLLYMLWDYTRLTFRKVWNDR